MMPQTFYTNISEHAPLGASTFYSFDTKLIQVRGVFEQTLATHGRVFTLNLKELYNILILLNYLTILKKIGNNNGRAI